MNLNSSCSYLDTAVKGNFLSFFLSSTSNITYFSVPYVTQDLRRVKHCGIQNNEKQQQQQQKQQKPHKEAVKQQNHMSTF